MELKWGEGGEDSKLFVYDLLSLYLKYAQSKKFSTEILDSNDEGHVIIKISGKNVWHSFRYESGKHCIQRIPPTESKGRKQTSYVAVAVLPLPPENNFDPLPENELEIKCQTGHGKGGQHQNKTASAVRMLHKPTQLHVFINGRDQHYNKQMALRILTAKVHEKLANKNQKSYNAQRKAQLGDAGRGDKIRTYNFLKSRITDHRTNKETSNVKQFMKGDLDLVR